MRDTTHTIQSLTDDILREVDERGTQEKTASEKKFEPKTELAKGLIKMAQEMRKAAEEKPRVTYSDLGKFRLKMESA